MSANAGAVTTQVKYAVGGMDCPGCAASIRQAVSGVAGVREAEVDFLSGSMSVTLEEAAARGSDIVSIVRGMGFTVSDPAAPGEDGADEITSRVAIAVLGASGALWATGLALALAGVDTASGALLVSAAAVGGFPLVRKAARDLARRAVTINVLMTIAVAGAMALQEWAEAATVVVLFAASELIEGRTVAGSRRAIDALLALIPSTVTLVREGITVDVAVADAVVGDLAMVRPGERIALDGTVVSGTSEVNEAPISGESKLLVKEAGDRVFAGSLNGSGSLDYSVTHRSDGTVLARLLVHVRDALSSRAPTQRVVDKFAAYYTPGMLALAAVTAVAPLVLTGQFDPKWLRGALVLLVAGCPCAFVLATPVATASAMARLARMGVLVKGGAQLESLGAVRAVALDKTGTLTAGTPQVLGVVALVGDEDELVALAADVERRSEHPLAHAIVGEAERRSIQQAGRGGEFEARPGLGATVVRDGVVVTVGSTRLLDELGVDYTECIAGIRAAEEEGATVVGVAVDGRMYGYIRLGDAVRPEARDAVAGLARVGVTETVMLTGDNQAAADRIALETGVGKALGGLLPEDKTRLVREMVAEHGTVLMVGDGVNDAPALAAATVGVAMGASGTDIAIETADVALMGDDLSKLPDALVVARRTRRTVVANIAIAAGVKAGVMALVAVGVATLWMAVAADVGLTLVVVGNSLRLLRAPRRARAAL